MSTIDQPNPLYASQVSLATCFDYNNAATAYTHAIIIIYCGFRKLSLICHLKKLMWRQLHEFQGSPQNHKYTSLAFPFSPFTPPPSLPLPLLPCLPPCSPPLFLFSIECERRSIVIYLHLCAYLLFF